MFSINESQNKCQAPILELSGRPGAGSREPGYTEADPGQVEKSASGNLLDKTSGVQGTGSPHHRQPLPPGNRFFPDRDREVIARAISWALDKGGDSGLFATLTFKDYVSPVRAGRMVKRWLARTQQSLKDSGGSSLKSICATEWQKRDVIHYHLLLVGNGLDTLSRKRLEHRWEAMGGGFARCYEASKKAAPYLAKYCSKTLTGDVQWDGTWQGLRFPASVSRIQAGALTDTG